MDETDAKADRTHQAGGGASPRKRQHKKRKSEETTQAGGEDVVPRKEGVRSGGREARQAPARMTTLRRLFDAFNRLPPALKTLIIAVIANVLATVIYESLRSLVLGRLQRLEIFGIGILVGAFAAGVVWRATAKAFWGGTTFALVTVIACLLGGAFVRPPVEVTSWDFEDGTTQNWGVYDEEKARVIQSPDVSVSTSPQGARGTHSLVVSKIDLPAESRAGAHLKWPAIHYEEHVPFNKVTALVYVPPEADFRYADANLFVFDGKWNWHQSKAIGKGFELRPGEWVELSWDLRYGRFWWSSPWRNVLGIQVYVEGTYEGPVHIDNVTLYR